MFLYRDVFGFTQVDKHFSHSSHFSSNGSHLVSVKNPEVRTDTTIYPFNWREIFARSGMLEVKHGARALQEFHLHGRSSTPMNTTFLKYCATSHSEDRKENIFLTP